MPAPRGVVPEPPGPGQESVWDYPRPPALVPTDQHVVVELGGGVVVDTAAAVRVLETSHPPAYYLPLADVAEGALRPVPPDAPGGTSWCEFKGRAVYYDLVGADGTVAAKAAWRYPDPAPGYEALADRIALYPGRMDRCTVDGEPVRPQGGGFYGGWITSRVVGPFKGAPGTSGW